jgi:hypothetical protein
MKTKMTNVSEVLERNEQNENNSLPSQDYYIPPLDEEIYEKKVQNKFENSNEPSNFETTFQEFIFDTPIITPKLKQSRDNFITLQKWEGFVLEVSNDSFIAQLHDLTNDMPDEEVELYIEEVPKSDRELLTKGAYFYWSIGYNDSPSGQRTRESMIRFKREPVWQKTELDKANQKAEELGRILEW